jgi:hypothetical protein
MSRNKVRRPTNKITERRGTNNRFAESVPGGSRSSRSQTSVMIGGIAGDPEAFAAAAELDKNWFRTHLHRSHRIRRALAGEVPAGKSQMYVVVRQLQPGVRCRLYFDTPTALPEDEAPEHIAHAIFDLAQKYHGARSIPGHELSQCIQAYAAGAGTGHSSGSEPHGGH